MWTWGRNYYGQCGHSITVAADFIQEPTMVKFGERFIKVRAGSRTTLALTKSNEVYWWGAKPSNTISDLGSSVC